MVQPEPVSVRDLEVADRIARAVRGGRPADRRPTLGQLLAAFGEGEPTLEARRRAARALALAGVATVPDLLEAAPGERITLEVRGTRKRRAGLFGALALVAVLGGAAALASTLDTSSTERVADLRSGTDTTTATQPPPTTETTTEATTEAAATTPETPSAADRRRKRLARERAARERRARERRARALVAARRRVTVRLTASRATFLCVDGDGRELFNGTLTGARSFRARVVRLNVGLGPSTRVMANGKPVALTGSPAGVQITSRRQTALPLGARPCA
jgi:hypothetical protein